jgi:rhodanese-related sulfurtransferase
MKKNLKLLLILFLIGLLAFSVVGCGQDDNNENVTPPPVTEEPDNDEEPALDPQEVLMEAAKAYFPLVANETNIIKSEDVKEMLDSNPNSVLILDIRTAEDFEAGHIPGAIHSEFGAVGDIMDRLPTNKPVVVACYTGQTAGQTVGALRMAGFDNVKSLYYGMRKGWSGESELPTEGTGMVAAADLPAASAPADEREEILWASAKEMFAAIVAGNRGLILPADLHEALEGNPNSFYVVDIRKLEDYEAGFIPGAIHSGWANIGNILETLPTNRPVVIGCYSGQTAGQTVGVLRMLGFDAKSLQSGVRDGWVQTDDLPLVTE